MTAPQLTAIEVFAGGGGFAVGLAAAGYKTVAAVEIERSAADTFKANHRDVQVFRQDVRTVRGDALLRLADGSLDVLAACPPCQGFSSLTSKYKKPDPRNELVLEVARLAEEMRPRAVIMENVPGLVDKGEKLFRQLLERLDGAGYTVNWNVLQVADFGVPQRRRRLVLFASLEGEIKMPNPTHSRIGKGGLSKWITLREELPDLGPAMLFGDARKLPGGDMANWHVVRRLSPENAERIRHAKPGLPRWLMPKELHVPCHADGYGGFSNVYGRLRWDEPSVTITAGCTTLSKGRFGHPTEDRTISLREAALLQTFPPYYRFDTTKFEHACDIVGNALPCRFAEVLARQVAQALCFGGDVLSTENVAIGAKRSRRSKSP